MKAPKTNKRRKEQQKNRVSSRINALSYYLEKILGYLNNATTGMSAGEIQAMLAKDYYEVTISDVKLLMGKLKDRRQAINKIHTTPNGAKYDVWTRV